MNKDDFIQKICKNVKVDDVLRNPGGGTSKIININKERIQYQRGKTKNFYLKFDDMYAALQQFPDGFSSKDLKGFRPDVFDTHARPAGHDCNCTFLMLILEEIGLVEKIEGTGKRGHPFYVEINQQ